MSEKEKTFYELWKERKVQAEDIDDFVNDWNLNEMAKDISIHEYLGLTFDKYVYWTRNPDNVMKMLMFKLNGKELC